MWVTHRDSLVSGRLTYMRILVVDDDLSVRESLRKSLTFNEIGRAHV